MSNSKAKSRRALGRGLSRLIPVEDEQHGSGNEVVQVDIEAIEPNPFQPRTAFDEEEIQGLAESIKNQGLLQPVVLRKLGDAYHIISGERRFRALKSLGRDRVPSIVKMQVSDREMLEMALVENIQREQLNEIEKANAYQKLLLECGLSHEQLSERVGKSRSAVTNTLRLLNLPEKVRIMLASGKLTMGHARAILGVEGEKARVDMARRIVEQNLTVRDVEQLSKSNTPAKNTKKKRGTAAAGAPERDPDLEEVTGKLRYHFGTSVNIIRKPDTKGKIEISFYSNDDLNRLLDLLLG